jgi:hypothetical protein
VTTLWLTLSAVLAYLLVGALYARSQSVRIYKEQRKIWAEGWVDREVRVALLFRVGLWPFFLVIQTLGRALGSWVMHPVTERQAHAEKLRADAKYWDGVAREEIDGEKKAMAEELAQSLREQAKGVGL